MQFSLRVMYWSEAHKVNRYENNMGYKKEPQCNYWGPFLP